MSEDLIHVRVTTKEIIFTAHLDKCFADKLHAIDKLRVENEKGEMYIDILKIEVLDQ